MIMSGNQKGKAVSIPVGISLGTIGSMFVTVSAASILAWLLNTQRMQWESIGYGALLTLIISALAGSEIACRKIKSRRLLVSILAGGAYLACLAGITALFFGGQYDGAAVTAAAVMGTSLAVGILEGRGGRKQVGTRFRIR